MKGNKAKKKVSYKGNKMLEQHKWILEDKPNQKEAHLQML